jgi:hypothetical protein
VIYFATYSDVTVSVVYAPNAIGELERAREVGRGRVNILQYLSL